jgi:hypothetical protein
MEDETMGSMGMGGGKRIYSDDDQPTGKASLSPGSDDDEGDKVDIDAQDADDAVEKEQEEEEEDPADLLDSLMGGDDEEVDEENKDEQNKEL